MRWCCRSSGWQTTILEEPMSGLGRLQWILLLGWLLSSRQPPESVDGWLLLLSSLWGSPFCIYQPLLTVFFCSVSAGFPPKPTTPPAPTTTRDPLADFCRGRPDGLYENAADKTTFLQCFNGITYLQRCQPGLIYWDSCKCCNWPRVTEPWTEDSVFGVMLQNTVADLYHSRHSSQVTLLLGGPKAHRS